MSDPWCKIGGMMTKTEMFNEVINTIYEDNFGHVDFMDNMGGDCDCNIHNVLNFLFEYEVA
jgi:UDP-N-acetylglucosamine enolpyruvyl transferase